MIFTGLSAIAIGFVLVGAVLFVIFKSATYDPDFERIQERERLNGNKDRKFVLSSCSQAVPMSISRSDPNYRFDYSVEF